VLGGMSSFEERDWDDTVTSNNDFVMVKYFPPHKAINTVNTFRRKLANEARILD
jgi:hypothetical protein